MCFKHKMKHGYMDLSHIFYLNFYFYFLTSFIVPGYDDKLGCHMKIFLYDEQ